MEALAFHVLGPLIEVNITYIPFSWSPWDTNKRFVIYFSLPSKCNNLAPCSWYQVVKQILDVAPMRIRDIGQQIETLNIMIHRRCI